jgi:hypothetical protein
MDRMMRTAPLALAALMGVHCGSREGGGPTRESSHPNAPDVASSSRPAVTTAPFVEPARLFVISGSADVLGASSKSAPVLGAVRAGGSVELRSPQVATRADRDCPEGWFAVLPEGFVCAGKGTTRDTLAPAARIFSDYHLAAHAALPASYGIAAMTPVYMRVPTYDEQVRSEPGIEQHLHRLAALREQQAAARASGYAPEQPDDRDLYPARVEVPDDLRGGSLAPRTSKPLAPASPVTGLLNQGTPVAWVGELDAADRTWLLTPDLLFVPRDKVKRAVISGYHGVEVPSGQGIAFVGQRPARRYHKVDRKKFVASSESWAPGTSVSLAEPATRWSDEKFLETTEPGVYLRIDEAIVAHPTPGPRWALDADSRFIEISAKTHLLMLHEGGRVTFATLVSVGSTGIPRGKFRVFSKHLSLATPFEHPRSGGTKAEVPEVLLAADTRDALSPFALFAGWWMTSWGSPNAGVGVALAPLDARRLFDWAAPTLPEGWHSVRGDGTWVVVRD